MRACPAGNRRTYCEYDDVRIAHSTRAKYSAHLVLVNAVHTSNNTECIVVVILQLADAYAATQAAIKEHWGDEDVQTYGNKVIERLAPHHVAKAGTNAAAVDAVKQALLAAAIPGVGNMMSSNNNIVAGGGNAAPETTAISANAALALAKESQAERAEVRCCTEQRDLPAATSLVNSSHAAIASYRAKCGVSLALCWPCTANFAEPVSCTSTPSTRRTS